MSALLLLSFHCLLRTGELLALYPSDLLLGEDSGIVSLQSTKSGKCNAATEAISITDTVTLEAVRNLLASRKALTSNNFPLWNSSPAAFRRRFAQLCNIFGLDHLQFRPYSLRRGGATDLFQQTQSMEAALIRGRWESSRVARIYISDGLSHLPKLTLSKRTQSMLQACYFLDPLRGRTLRWGIWIEAGC